MMAVQFHTEGLRQPMLIGKDPAGKKLWGGPYVVWQAAGLLVAPVLWNTADWWAASMGPLGRVMLIIAATIGACWALGRLDFAGRNPAWALGGLFRALWHCLTGSGRLRSRTARPTPPRSDRQSPAVIIGVPAPLTGSEPVGAAAAPMTTAVVSDLAQAASGTTAEPTPQAQPDQPAPPIHTPTVPATPPVRRLSPLEAFLAAAGSSHGDQAEGSQS